MKISIILPSRNNLKYLKWSYDAIRKNQGDHEVQICVADDASTDGTSEWLEKTSMDDPNLSYIVNDSGNRVGHTILYDRLVNEVAEHDVCMIYHADMYLCPGSLDAIEKYIEPKTIVSLTRIEPPLHPAGPEKIVQDFGTEPETFDEEGLLATVHSKSASHNVGVTTEGIFAPWAFWKSDFQEIGGHDPLYRPQSKEDSDIFNRFQLNGVKFIQTWEGYVYHMTCRGSRFNPTLTTPGTNSNEWEAQNLRSTRNFIRKWGHMVKHDEYMKPIIPPKYDITIYAYNCTDTLLKELEPWCSSIYSDADYHSYIEEEQPNTDYDLSARCFDIMEGKEPSGIHIAFDTNMINFTDLSYIHEIASIIETQEEVGPGTFKLGNLKITIHDLARYEMDLIHI